MKQLLTYIFLLGITLLSIATTSAQESGFNLIVVGDTQPQTEEQFERLKSEVMPNLELIIDEYRQKSNLPIIVLITGDVVWDNMAFLPRLKELFSSLDVELITVIGNHDHDRNTEGDESAKEQAYEAAFGARYKSFTLAPIPSRELGHVNCALETVSGRIESRWYYKGDEIYYEFTVPEGAVARITLPDGYTETVGGGSYFYTTKA